MVSVLVVDDESVDRELAVRSLETLGELEIVHAADGAEALEALAARRVDLVLTDLRMPGMDGLELVDRVKQDFPLIPVVLMTGRGSEQTAVQALEAGAASYVPKVDLKEHLAETVEQVLEIAEEGRSRRQVLSYLGHRETQFELANDLRLISSLVGYVQQALKQLELGNDSWRTRAGVALSEALSNAIIHGNLEVGSELRDRDAGEYYALIEQRRDQAPFASRRVCCIVRESAQQIEYVVEDEGPGFDYEALPDPTAPENVVRVRGRGLMLIRTFMDRVEFNDRGNRIAMTKLCAD